MTAAVAVAFAVAAGVGAVARALAGVRLNRHGGFPLGTLLVNVTGSFALGLLHGTGAPAATVAGTGLLGAFTTFSSFSRDTIALAEDRRAGLVAAYLAASTGGSVLAAAAGVALV